jgi:DNA-binding NarL/FixJ family response regulator
MNNLQNCVLIVEDEFLIAHAVGLLVKAMGLAVCGKTDNAKDAVALAALHRPKVIVMDARLRGNMNGVDAALAIHQTVNSSIIFMTGSRDSETMTRIQLAEPSAVLIKPASREQLTSAISDAMGLTFRASNCTGDGNGRSI